MPSSMTHLLCAKVWAPERSSAFYVGNIAPDCIDVREFKDRTHLRNIPEESRLDALRALARTYDWINDEYLLGIIYHLFADFTWDIGPQKIHREKYTGDNWFIDYRREINEVGRQIYARHDWSKGLWDAMAELDPSLYASEKEYPPENIRAFILRNREKAALPCENPSKIFTPEAVDAYAAETAERFSKFMRTV